MLLQFWFHFRFPRSLDAVLDGCKIIEFGYRIITNIASYAKYNYFFVMVTVSMMSHCDFENSKISARDTLLASRVMIPHYCDVIIGAMVSQITSLTIVYTAVHSDPAQRKHQSSASLAFVWGIQRRPVNSPRKWPLTRKMFPFDDVIMMCHILVSLFTHYVWELYSWCFTSYKIDSL